jgi:hypothetical protein
MQGVYPTDWPAAFAAITNDVTASAWLRSHPNARIAYLQHAKGAPGSGITDRWSVDWSGGPSDGAHVAVTAREALGGLVPRPLEVTFSPKDDVPNAPAPTDRVELAGIVALAKQFFGAEPDVLRCYFDEGYCGVGTHEAMGAPFATDGASGASQVQSGLLWDVAEGRLLQVDIRGPVVASQA